MSIVPARERDRYEIGAFTRDYGRVKVWAECYLDLNALRYTIRVCIVTKSVSQVMFAHYDDGLAVDNDWLYLIACMPDEA